MAEAVLNVDTREESGKQAAKQLRSKGFIPAILYGPGETPSLLSINRRELTNLLNSFGRNIVVNLTLDKGKKEIKTFMYEIQIDPISGNIIHIDFKHISLKEKIHVEIPIHLEGTPEGVRNEGGIIEHIMHTLEIRCFPTDIPEKITFDVTTLHIGDVIHVKDIKQENFEIIPDPERTVIHIIPPRVVVVEEVEEEIAEVVEGEIEEAAEPEVIGKKPEETDQEKGE